MKRILAYAQLLRLPNVFTALADIGIGILVPGVLLYHWAAAICILLTSACLYCAGMVLNDIFDFEEDCRDRPSRPLPSGRVSRANASSLAGGLVLAASICSSLSELTAAYYLTAALAIAIVAYDAWLKRIWIGPVGMGLCRFLNVLLGWTLVGTWEQTWPVGVHVAAVVGVYIVGVTWFARTEAAVSSRSMLVLAAMVMAASTMVALCLPLTLRTQQGLPTDTPSPLFVPLLLFHAILVGIPVCRAIAQPTPARVQTAVKTAILGLIVLDTGLASAFAGPMCLVLLVLLAPAVLLGRWVYST